ncbi:MAG: DNA alkylation repair protein [Leptolinea sp.]|jgi:3-methyladenine DNA glycosylase AlkD|nr:DNA alkylation repair protein [Leptolinea sp.]
MNTKEARDTGNQLAGFIHNRQIQKAINILSPVLVEKTSFRLLDVIGACIGQQTPDTLDPFLERIAANRSMGGWIIIASALRQQSRVDLPGALERCRRYVIRADVWYAADSFAERVAGHALVEQFSPAISILAQWRNDPSVWVRRVVGVAVHYWAKQARGDPARLPEVNVLLDFLAPMFGEREMDAVKGIGWGLKTLGRYYPDAVDAWLSVQVDRPHRALMQRKAARYLPAGLREQFSRKTS